MPRVQDGTIFDANLSLGQTVHVVTVLDWLRTLLFVLVLAH